MKSIVSALAVLAIVSTVPAFAGEKAAQPAADKTVAGEAKAPEKTEKSDKSEKKETKKDAKEKTDAKKADAPK